MKFSTAALGFMLAFNGASAAPIRERALEIYTVIQTWTEVVHTTSTVWEPASTKAYAPIPTTAPYDTPSAVAQLVAVTPTPYSPSSSSPPPPPPSSAPSIESISSTLPTSLPPVSVPSAAAPVPSTAASAPSTTIPIPILPTPTPIVVPTPTSIVVVPTPTSIVVPTATYVPPTTTAAPVVPTPPPSVPPPSVPIGGSQGMTTGTATFYDVGMGSCGLDSIASDLIVALPFGLMDATYNANPNKNIQCGRKIKCQQIPTASNPNPPAVVVVVMDRCPGCKPEHLDLSRGAYQALGCTEDQGVCPIEWSFV